MPFRDSAQQLVQQKQFDDVEALWMSQLESDPSDVDAFLTAAKSLRKAEQRNQSDTLLGLLADALKERKLWHQRLQVLKEIGRLSRHPATLRPAIEEALRKTYADRKTFNRAFEFAKFSEPQSNPVEKADKIETWLNYDEGECFFMTGRGAGTVIELNPELGICRLDFEKDKRVAVPLGAAGKFLTRLQEGHVLREKFSDPAGTREKAKKSPPEFFARILQSFGRPMTMAEVRDAVIGIVPEEKWSTWWTSARKNPQIVVSGTGAKATYSWSASTGDAEKTVRRDFERADTKTKLDLARKHSSRSQEIADFFATTLAAEATRIARTDAATAWQILTTLQSLPGKYTSAIDPKSLLQGAMASRAV
ncbi:MAG: hypothetical protein ACXV7D_07325, partial [Thermoanaerobaculia bacterium]